MKLHINRKSFLSAANKANAALCARSSLPILAHLRLEAGKQGLQIVGTDLDKRISVNLEADVAKTGVVCLPARRLLDGAALMSCETLGIKVNGPRATVSDGNGSTLQLAHLPSDEFPPEPPDEAGQTIEFAAGELPALFKRLIPFAAAPNQSRPHLESIIINGSEFVATDGRTLRLCRAQNRINGLRLLPIEAAKVMVKMGDCACRLRLGENSATLESETWTLKTRLIEKGDMTTAFYQPFLEADPAYAVSVEAPAEALLAAIALASVGSNPLHQVIRLEARKGKLALSGMSQEAASEITVPESTCTLPQAISINPDYLERAIKSLGGECVFIFSKSNIEPIKLNDSDGGFAVVLPIRTE